MFNLTPVLFVILVSLIPYVSTLSAWKDRKLLVHALLNLAPLLYDHPEEQRRAFTTALVNAMTSIQPGLDEYTTSMSRYTQMDWISLVVDVLREVPAYSDMEQRKEYPLCDTPNATALFYTAAELAIVRGWSDNFDLRYFTAMMDLRDSEKLAALRKAAEEFAESA